MSNFSFNSFLFAKLMSIYILLIIELISKQNCHLLLKVQLCIKTVYQIYQFFYPQVNFVLIHVQLSNRQLKHHIKSTSSYNEVKHHFISQYIQLDPFTYQTIKIEQVNQLTQCRLFSQLDFRKVNLGLEHFYRTTYRNKEIILSLLICNFMANVYYGLGLAISFLVICIVQSIVFYFTQYNIHKILRLVQKIQCLNGKKTIALAIQIILILLLASPIIILIIYFIILTIANGSISLSILFGGITLIIVILPNFNILQEIKFLLILISLTIHQLIAVYKSDTFSSNNYIYSWYSQSAVYLFLNGLLSSLCIIIAKNNFWTISQMVPIFKDQITKQITCLQQDLDIYTGGILNKIKKLEPKFKILSILSLYIFSIIFLLAYSIVSYYLTPFKQIATIISLSIVALDALMILIAWQELALHPIFQIALIFSIRISLFVFGPQLWFSGFCLVFMFITCYLGYQIIQLHLPLIDQVPETNNKFINLAKRPQLSLTLLVLGFIFINIILAVVGNTTIPNKVIAIGLKSYSFWALSIGSFLVSMTIILAMASFRIYQRQNQQVQKMIKFYFLQPRITSLQFSLILLQLCLVGLGSFFYSQTGWNFIWQSCLFIPIMIFSIFVAYKSWIINDFQFLCSVQKYNEVLINKQKARKLRNQRYNNIKKTLQKQQQQLAQLHIEQQSFQQNLQEIKTQDDWKGKYNVISAFFYSKLRSSDYSLIFSLFVFLISSIGFGVLVYYTNKQDQSNKGALYGWNISISLLHFILLQVPLHKIYRINQISLIQNIIFILLYLATLIIYGIIYFQRIGVQQNSIYFLLFMISYFPGISLQYYSVSFLRDCNYTFSIKFIIANMLSLALLLSGGGLTIKFIGSIAGSALILLVIYYYLLLTMYSYNQRLGQIPFWMKVIGILFTLAVFVGIVIASFISPNSNSLFGFSVAYLIITFSLLITGLAQIYYYDEQGYIFISPKLFPIYYLDTCTDKLVALNIPMIQTLLGLILLIIYGGIIGAFYDPCQIGIAVQVIGQIISVILLEYFVTKTMYESGLNNSLFTKDCMSVSWQSILKRISQQSNSLKQQQIKYKDVKLMLDQAVTNQDIIAIQKLESQLSQLQQEENKLMIQWWMRALLKVDSSSRLQMKNFLAFISAAQNTLLKYNIVFIVQTKGAPLQKLYIRAKCKLMQLSLEQQIRFKILRSQWQKFKQDHQKQRQQQRSKQEQAKKMRQTQLFEKMQQQQKKIKNIDITKIQFKDMPQGIHKHKLRCQLYKDKQFEDLDFKDTNTGVPNQVKSMISQFKRPIKGSQLFKEGASAFDVRQGKLGDCYLISSLGVTGEKIKQNLGIGQWNNPNGCFLVRFYKFKKQIFVAVDDKLYYTKQQGIQQPLFATSQTLGQLWPSILQKAYAKLNGGFNSIQRGKMHIALSQLTGGFPQQLILKQFVDKQDVLWKKLQNNIKNKYLMGVGSPDNPQGDSFVSPQGIVQRHAYLIITCKVIDNNRLIYLRNPHGKGMQQWTGPWSDTSQLWTARLKNIAQFTPQQDGAFWMSIEDFVYQFSSLYICRNFQKGCWKNILQVKNSFKNCDGLPNKNFPKADISKNPHFIISVTKQSNCFVVLSQKKQKENAFIGEDYLFFMIQKNGGNRIINAKQNVILTSGVPKNSMVLSMQSILKSDKYPCQFTLMISNYVKNKESQYNLQVFIDDINGNAKEMG